MNHTLKKGIYCLVVRLIRNCYIKIGCLGTFRFPAGFYVYVGSAQNNLERRIQRHLRRKKEFHWHIDYLLHYGNIISVRKYAGKKDAECVLSRKIRNIKNAVLLIKGFGSSDCTCLSHLYFFHDDPCPKLSGM